MKILKYVLGIIAILVIAFLAVGMIKSELSYDCEITVEKPASESWAVMQDESKLSEWLPGYQRSEQVSGTPGTAGAVSIIHFENDGQAMAIQETITEIVPNESMAMTYTSDFMDMDYKLMMTSVDGNTKISSSTNASGNGMFSRSMIALMGSSIKAQEEMNLLNLKNTIESNTKDYSEPDVSPSQETME